MAYRAIRWNQLSLRNKLTVVIVALLTLGLVIAGIGTTLLLRPALVAQLDAQLNDLARNPATIVGGDVSDQTFDINNIRNAPQPYFVALLDEDGEVIVSNWNGPTALRPDASDLVNVENAMPEQGAPFGIQTIRTGTGEPWRAIVVPEADYSSDTASGTLVIARDMKTVEATMAAFLAIFFGFGLTVVIFAAALTRLLVSATLQPLREVEGTAISFAAGDYSQRLAGATPNTEVGRLSRSLNIMLGRIDQAIEQRNRTIEQMRRFVGDASHELRTPLVTVRGYAELYRMGALDEPEKVGQAMDRIEKEALRMGGLVEDLLQLARLDETKELVRTIIDLEPLAEDAAMDATAQAPDRRIRALGVRIVEPGADEAGETPDEHDTGALDADDRSMDDTGPSSPGSDPTADRPAATTDVVPVDEASAEDVADAGAADSRPALRRWLPTGIARPNVGRLLRRRGAADQRESGPPAAADPVDTHAPVDLDEVGDDVPAMVLANEDKVRQAISNLIGNALRYTPPGSPLEIGITLDPPERQAVVEIIDHGEGIPLPIRQKIFQRFWRADTSRDRATGGSGLGLAIVSAIMRANEGSVDVVETPGGGATFRLVFPLLMAEDVDDVVSTPAVVDTGDDLTYS